MTESGQDIEASLREEQLRKDVGRLWEDVDSFLRAKPGVDSHSFKAVNFIPDEADLVFIGDYQHGIDKKKVASQSSVSAEVKREEATITFKAKTSDGHDSAELNIDQTLDVQVNEVRNMLENTSANGVKAYRFFLLLDNPDGIDDMASATINGARSVILSRTTQALPLEQAQAIHAKVTGSEPSELGMSDCVLSIVKELKDGKPNALDSWSDAVRTAVSETETETTS